MARYIVNSGGVIHSVNDTEFDTHMAICRQTAMQRTKTPDGMATPAEQVQMPREATPDEIAAWWAAQGLVYDPETGEAVSKAEAAERSKKAEKPAK